MKLRKGEKAVVTVNKKKESPEIQRGMIPGVSVPDYLPRRVSGIHIRYFDRGCLADGSDIGFVHLPTLEEARNTFILTPFPANPWVRCEGQDVAGTKRVYISNGPSLFSWIDIDYAPAFNTHILDGDQANWANTYKEIDDTIVTEYSLALVGDGGYVPGKGWLPSEAEISNGHIRINSSNHLVTFDTDGTSAVWHSFFAMTSKITTTPTYAAASATFTLDASCDVFLMPTILFHWGHANSPGDDNDPTTYTAGAVGGAGKAWALNAICQPISRPLSINNSTWDDFRSVSSGSASFKETMSVATRNWWYDYHTSLPDARCYFFHIPSQPISVASLPGTSPTNFPQDNSTSTLERNYRPQITITHFAYPEGLLIAVIKKKGVFYYVWNTTGRYFENAQRHIGGFV